MDLRSVVGPGNDRVVYSPFRALEVCALCGPIDVMSD